VTAHAHAAAGIAAAVTAGVDGLEYCTFVGETGCAVGHRCAVRVAASWGSFDSMVFWVVRFDDSPGLDQAMPALNCSLNCCGLAGNVPHRDEKSTPSTSFRGHQQHVARSRLHDSCGFWTRTWNRRSTKSRQIV
jgi:hypothetical protein